MSELPPALEQCPHGYVISDTTHQCPKCGPVESPTSKTVSLRKLLLDVSTYLRNSVGVPHDYEGVPRVELLEGIAAHLTRIDSQVETTCVEKEKRGG